MPGKVIVGAQWGDEGKGKYIDIFASSADMVVRSQGGNNAGHTVVVGEDIHKLHIIPSGILYKNCANVIGPGAVVDPKDFLTETAGLKAKGIGLSKLFIDARAHVIMPWHIALDILAEERRGALDIGTTRRGIGPCYTDKAARTGIRMHDFIDPEKLKKAILRAGEEKNREITALFSGRPFDLFEIIEEYAAYAKKIRPFVTDTSTMVHNALKAGKNVLFEGAQGTLLDLDMGTYPFVTSSHPVSGGACIGSGVGPAFISECIGVAKAYTTRVGKGPFPSELTGDIGEYIRRSGGEYGTTTGRPRRTGWFDCVVARYSVRTNSLTEMILNKIDPLRGLEKLRLCTAYRLGGKLVREFPPDFAVLSGCEPVYEEFEGFFEDITAVKDYDQLPQTVKAYIEAVEGHIGCPIRLIGVGPGRDQIIRRA